MQPISEAYMLPVIEQMIEQFPFDVLGFHADNGSEYVNHRVARMLDKLKVEFTGSVSTARLGRQRSRIAEIRPPAER